MPGAPMAGPPLPRSSFGAYLGRNQGPELFFTQAHPLSGTAAVASQVVIPKTLSMNRPLAFIDIKWSGRVVIGVANYDAVASEAPATILDRIKVFGTFKGTSLTPIDLSGATAQAWARLFGLRGSSVYINGTRQADPSVPYQQVGATFGNTGTFDLEIYYRIPLFPLVSTGTRSPNIVPYCWQPRDWNDTVQIQLNVGDRTSFGTPNGATTVAFSAFGSGAGSPQIEIFTSYLILGPLASGFRSACVVRNEQGITTLTAIANQVRVALLQKQKTTNVLVKTGRLLAGTSSGVSVYSDLRDVLLDETQIVVDNRPIRNNRDNGMMKEHLGLQFNTILPEGYLPLTFVDSQSPRSALRADLPGVVAPGASFELTSNVIEANAASFVQVTQEQIFADADDPAWAGTR